MEYVILDEGWSDPQNMFSVKNGINMPELAACAKEKNVKLILWCVWYTLDRQMEDAFELFEKWRIAGVKVDFIDRDDQITVNFYEKVLKLAAEYKIIVDFHGAFKPTGLERTYPNCITREGVKGLEWNKFSDKGIPPDHEVLLTFTRMVAGPMDYTPGAMRNMTAAN
ncbi:MAG: alpha-glucosidase [Spirosomataceae bacterium]